MSNNIRDRFSALWSEHCLTRDAPEQCDPAPIAETENVEAEPVLPDNITQLASAFLQTQSSSRDERPITVIVNMPNSMIPDVIVHNHIAAPNTPAPVVHVEVPKQAPPKITVEIPKQDAPTIVVKVPKQKPPPVNVTVNPPKPVPTKTTIVRDDRGNIIESIQTPVTAPNPSPGESNA